MVGYPPLSAYGNGNILLAAEGIPLHSDEILLSLNEILLAGNEILLSLNEILLAGNDTGLRATKSYFCLTKSC